MNYSGYMSIQLPYFVYMHCSLTGFGPPVYNTISSLQKRMSGHPTDFEACNSLRCQKQLHHKISVNESRTKSAVWLYLILCQVQTVHYNIYMDDVLHLILCQVQTVPYDFFYSRWRTSRYKPSVVSKVSQVFQIPVDFWTKENVRISNYSFYRL